MITLNTIVYEGNFKEVLSLGGWFLGFTSKHITKRMITVNNIDSIIEFNEMLELAMKMFNLEVVYVEKYKYKVIKKFNLEIDESTLGYVYTIPYFVTIDNVDTEFLLNIASDCMDDIRISDEFLEKAILELVGNSLCSTTMIPWTKNNYVMKNGKTIGEYEESETLRILSRNVKPSDNFHYTAGFTDQFFLGRVETLKKIDYRIDESISNQIYHGPSYGGNSFEKRIVGHQIKNNVYNCVYKGTDYYIHDKKYY